MAEMYREEVVASARVCRRRPFPTASFSRLFYLSQSLSVSAFPSRAFPPPPPGRPRRPLRSLSCCVLSPLSVLHGLRDRPALASSLISSIRATSAPTRPRSTHRRSPSRTHPPRQAADAPTKAVADRVFCSCSSGARPLADLRTGGLCSPEKARGPRAPPRDSGATPSQPVVARCPSLSG